MPISQKQANETKPCNERLRGYERTTGGTPIPVICTRPYGHQGQHSDQRDGVPLDWTVTSGPTRHPVALGGFRIAPATHEQSLREMLQKIVNLSGHPYFPEVKDLPTWDSAIQEARNLLCE